MSGDHVPVLLDETIRWVLREAAARGRVYVDATFGRGGHTRALLENIGAQDRVIAIDRDPEAVASGTALAESEPRLTMCHAAFSELGDVLEQQGSVRADGVIMDLGVSSPQLDTPGRGFSFRADGPLDMRMDPSRGASAAEWLNSADETDIRDVIRRLGEERFAGRIAGAIVRARPLTSTRALADVVSESIPARFRSPAGGGRHAATRTFQAVRMHVNDELGELEVGLEQAFENLQPGGRLAVITFHSLEDRLVKQRFRTWSRGEALPRRLPVREMPQAPGKIVAGPVRAGEAELSRNPRARSATLRVLERVA